MDEEEYDLRNLGSEEALAFLKRVEEKLVFHGREYLGQFIGEGYFFMLPRGTVLGFYKSPTSYQGFYRANLLNSFFYIGFLFQNDNFFMDYNSFDIEDLFKKRKIMVSLVQNSI